MPPREMLCALRDGYVLLLYDTPPPRRRLLPLTLALRDKRRYETRLSLTFFMPRHAHYLLTLTPIYAAPPAVILSATPLFHPPLSPYTDAGAFAIATQPCRRRQMPRRRYVNSHAASAMPAYVTNTWPGERHTYAPPCVHALMQWGRCC